MPGQPSRFSDSLKDFIASFGVSLQEISPHHLGYFLAARSLAPLVKGLSIPAAESRGDGALPAQDSRGERVSAPQGGGATEQAERFPTPSFTIGPAKACDLRHILPHQFCYPTEQLLYLLANGKLTRRVMLREADEPSSQDAETPKLLDSPEQGNRHHETQRAYILLDVSQSMNGEVPPGGRQPDRRGMVARGLALAFLEDAKARYAQLHLRPFSSTVGVRESALSSPELQLFVRKVLDLHNDGSTALQKTLEAAEADLAAMDPVKRVDIMLISDGASFLSGKPFQDRFLHTFLIGDSCAPEKRGGSGAYEKLQQWSETFAHISNCEFGEILAPTRHDLMVFTELARESAERLPFACDRAELRLLQHQLELAQMIAQLSLEFGSEEERAEAAALRSKVADGLKAAAAPKAEAEALARESEYEARCALYDAHLPARFRAGAAQGGRQQRKDDPKDLSASMSARGGASSSATLLELVQGVINRLRHLVHRFFHHS